MDTVFDEAPMDDIFDAFRMNLAPFLGLANYARERSEEAAFRYAHEHYFTTEDFGRTAYAGEIALLHIDGNHSLGCGLARHLAVAPIRSRRRLDCLRRLLLAVWNRSPKSSG